MTLEEITEPATTEGEKEEDVWKGKFKK
jgi:hypothetical protein